MYENSDTENIFENEDDSQIPGLAKNHSAPYTTRIIVACMLYFLLLWQALNMVSNAALSQLLSFIFQFLQLAATQSPFCAGLAACFPPSIYLLHKWIGIDKSRVDRFICCPTCMAIYRYEDVVIERSKNCYDVRRCVNEKLLPRTKLGLCGTKLVDKIVLKNGKTTYKPIKTFHYQSVLTSLESLLQRADVERECAKWKERQSAGLSDVYDGQVWRDFLKRPGGDPFLSGDNCYAFILNVDWFQPYKHRSDLSVGVIYMSLLNLPQAMRYKSENIIVVGVIPSFFKEPKQKHTFLGPLVAELNMPWNKGVKMRTCLHPAGCTVFAALVCAAADIPAARKLCGFLSH